MRYVWFSSANFCPPDYVVQGQSPGTPIAFVDLYQRNGTTLFITEGIFKAIAINKCYGCPVLAVQGVGNFKDIVNDLKVVIEKYPRLQRVLIAYDADFINNANVTAQAVRLYRTMLESVPNLIYQYVLWDEKYGKGFDDLISNTGGWNLGTIVKTIDMDKFAQTADELSPFFLDMMRGGQRDQIGKVFRAHLSQYFK